MKAIKWIRVILSAAVMMIIAALVWLGHGKETSRWLITIDVLSLSLGALGAWLLATLLLGRVYCSWACPLGTAQDAVAWLARKAQRRSSNYRYTAGDWRMRCIVLLLVVVSMVGDTSHIHLLSDPFTLTATPLQAASPYVDFQQSTDMHILSYSLLGIVATVLVWLCVVVLAWRGGRTFCNTFCPIGTALGTVSQVSLYRFDINPDLCVHCGECERVCKSSCINSTEHTIDHSRCVMCINCAAACPNDAIKYRIGRHQITNPLLQRTTSLNQAKE